MIKGKIENKDFDYEDENSWRLIYSVSSGRGFFRLDYGKALYKVWSEEDFLNHIKELEEINK